MKNIIYSIVLGLIFIQSTYACTTAVISGKYTKDGRPMLWKHRDTWAINNKIMQFNDGKYSYIALVNSKDKSGKSIWIGYNSAGFAIMNSASYNLNNDTIKQSGLEGRLMKEALQNCATIDDFEAMLKAMDKPTRLEANFGVIDAQGGAAYFELANFRYTKYDATDPVVAPYGYIIRTNHSMSGELGKGGGYIRYITTDKEFLMAVKENRLTPKTIIQNCSRNMTNSLTNVNLYDYIDIPANHPTYVSFTDFVPRSGTSSSVIVEGVKKGQSPENSVMWTVLGWPLASVCIPLWLNDKVELPKIVQYDDKVKDSPLCNMALQAKKQAFSYTWGYSSKYYINVNALLNADKTGLIQLVTPFENTISERANTMINSWGDTPDDNKIKEFYDWIDAKVPMFFYANWKIKPEVN
ncbi:MAG TPA: hypothetical protein ENK91_15455 [Bacteroidetes bacterium]|nr:hypothetical protein [Bacteroidota bacterium]